MKKLLAIALVLILSFSVFASGSGEAASSSQDSDTIKIALIIENTIDDKGWCQAMHDGITQAMEQLPGKIEYSYSEKMLPVCRLWLNRTTVRCIRI